MIDASFDCRQDAGGIDRDPDRHSPTLRRYHQLLWSKPLPCGRPFTLDISGPKPFLIHRSEIGEFHLTSDAITHRYADRKWLRPQVEHLPQDLRAFVDANAWPVSECIVFPGKKIDGKVTINGARGMCRALGDRFDLALECIRRFYLGETSPIYDVLARYSDFFALFEDFRGYVDFFLLQDLVNGNNASVKFHLPFDGFKGHPLPQDLESYVRYLSGVVEFSARRRDRVTHWCQDNLQGGGFAR